MNINPDNQTTMRDAGPPAAFRSREPGSAEVLVAGVSPERKDEMHTALIRKAVVQDVGQIEALLKSIPGFWDQSWRPNVLEIVMSRDSTVAYVCAKDERIIGFACAHDNGFRAYLSELVVAKEFQGSGIGKDLLRAIEEDFRVKGVKVLIADVWNDELGFYNKLGWSAPSVVLLRKKL